jgi:Ca2+/Na+ antiporter
MIFSIYHITSIKNIKKIIIIAVILYSWFLLTTRLNPIYNIFILVVLIFCFLLNIKISHLENNNFDENTNKKINQLKKLIFNIFIFIISITFIIFIIIFLF